MATKKIAPGDAFQFVRYGKVDPKLLSPSDWYHLIGESLKACAPVLRKVAEKNRKAMLMKDILNCDVEGGKYSEKRITPDEVVQSLPKSLAVNDEWLFIPVCTLESREEDGRFFEKRLFILADFARLVIVDVVFRKEPQPKQRAGVENPLMDEHVLECKVMIDQECLGLKKDGFFETMMRHLGDSKKKLGEHIINDVLDYAVTELRERRSKVNEIQKGMQSFLDVRKRLGYIDCI